MALEPLAEVFTDLILEDQDCFRTEEQAETLLKLLPDKGLVETLREQWGDKEMASASRWAEMKDAIMTIPKGTTRRVRHAEF